VNDAVETQKIEEQVYESKSSRSSSSSGYGYDSDNYQQLQPEKPKVPSFIPKLNFGGGVATQGGFGALVDPAGVGGLNEYPPTAPEKAAPSAGFVVPKLGLNLENIKKQDFQDEFMDKFDEYSQSWRDMIEKQKRF